MEHKLQKILKTYRVSKLLCNTPLGPLELVYEGDKEPFYTLDAVVLPKEMQNELKKLYENN